MRAYGLALHRLLALQGISVTVVSPGFVDTPMSASLKIALPFLWTSDRAARHIANAITRRRREVLFPWQLALGVRLASVLPQSWVDGILGRLGSRA